ncbi:MAG: alginate export family protein [Gemmatimonadales bacterium]
MTSPPMSRTLLGLLCLALAGQAQAQEPAEGERTTGLPKKVQWTFTLDAGLGVFGFDNSLYTDVRPDPSGDLSDNWVESFVRPGLSASYGLGRSQLYGRVSVAGERTFAAPPPLVGEEASSFQVEDLYLGWRSGTTISSTENLVDLTVGRAPYTLGHGFILWDGGGEGGSRGGFWSNARKAWEFAGIGRVKPGKHTFEGFYLNRDEVPEANSHTDLWGANYEFGLNDESTVGASYLKFSADPDVLPDRDGMDVFNLRAFVGVNAVPGLAFEAEWAREENDAFGSTAWTAQASYEFTSVGWSPRFSYRYAMFEGDDPDTPENEAFDPLIPGFYDWGTWWQGEIGGEYFLANSNLVTHQARVHVAPSGSLGAGLIGYVFRADQPATFAPGVTSDDIGTELDAYADWKINRNFTASFVAAFASPGDAAEQAFDRTSTFTYGMIYLAYSY